jgi:polyribonucleotide nucleotidyltransferase
MDSLTLIFTLLAVAAVMVFKSLLFGGGAPAAPAVEAKAPKAAKAKKAKKATASAPAPAAAPAPKVEMGDDDDDSKKKTKKKKKKGKPDLVAKLAKEEEEAEKASAARKAAKAKKKKSAKAAAPVFEADSGADDWGGEATISNSATADDDDGWDAVPTAVELKRKAAKKKAHKALPTPKGQKAADGSVVLDLGSSVAAIIGKGGETIKKLQADSGANLDIQKSDDGSSSIKISGDDSKSVNNAVAAVKAILAKSAGFNQASAGTAKATVNAGDKMARVIGRGGSTIKFIGANSGARIDTSREEGDSTITISGTSEQVAVAKALVLQAISGVDIEAEATQTIDIGAKNVPLIIGSAGSTIKMLQANTSAKIDIARGSSSCTVSGSADAVSAAVSAIRKLILDNSHGQTVAYDCHIGVIIGKGGATIRSVQEASGAKVDIESSGDGCLVSFSGTEVQIAAAQAAVERVVAAESAAPELADGEVSETIELPESCVGSVIGKQGASIRALQEETGAKVDISRGTGSCTVYGQPEGVAKAVAALEAIVAKQAKFDEDKASRDVAAAAMMVDVVEESGEDSVWAAPSTDSGW